MVKISLLISLAFGITIESKAQKVITLKPNGEVKEYSNAELKSHRDFFVDGNRIYQSDSGQIYSELYMINCKRNGYYKAYKNGILVELGLFKDNVRIGTHYFWDETGLLKKSITYKDGKEIAIKQY